MRWLTAIGIVCLLLTGGPAPVFAAAPQPAVSDPAAAARDATAVAHAFFRAGNLAEVLRKSIAESLSAESMDFPREEWKGLLKQAVEVEFDRHLADLEVPFGHLMAQGRGDAELHAGAVFLNSPLGQRFLAVATAGSSGRVVPELTAAEKAEIGRSARDPNLRAFMTRGFEMPAPPPALMQDFIAAVLPDVLIRFGEAAKAAEAQRKAASPP